MPEKLQTVLWILVALVVFVWRMIQKARATTAREQQERRYSRPDSTGKPRPVTSSPSAKSFEDLLQQMMAENTGQAKGPVTTPAGRALPQEAARPTRSLEAATEPARSQEKPAKMREPRSLEAPATVARRASAQPRAAVQHGQEDYWSRQQAQQAPPASFAEQLRNPTDVRRAFILGEILQRRF
ncbi:hypothetical protein [Hymenobacter guriensis]|uniref:Uncharacterized protein n=1 Tax=Hymenobacter guriensis TaxID=2793065 RepID=A0ABS0L1P3_9BACT|nr:hypothetical protein [Hymenobacter guriensis]MBG8554030.1 hypothetical protein [Hymenobacter guriensis]